MHNENYMEVYDFESDVVVYNIRTHEITTCPQLSSSKAFETFPAFSPDGKSIYFCSADSVAPMPERYLDTHYSLCRIDFDPATGTFGSNIDIIVDAAVQKKSVSFPRPSYDGRFLCYTLSDYGQFSIWHHEADLYLLDLSGEGRISPLTQANSPDTESFHNWSTNSRWLVLSSRRDDGLYTRPYFCHIDANGVATKAFMLPQRNPRRFYRDRFLSFNVPDFITAPTRFDSRQASRAINDESRKDFGVRK
jgi:dipeptidyl aminopeptidase/acylaminoacyl peptidase